MFTTGFLIIFCGYFLFNYALQCLFYSSTHVSPPTPALPSPPSTSFPPSPKLDKKITTSSSSNNGPVLKPNSSPVVPSPTPMNWKAQPLKGKEHIGDFWPWLPLISRKAGKKAPFARLYPSFNLVLSSAMMGLTLELISRGHSQVYFALSEHSLPYLLLVSLFLPILWQCALEYYWHRLLHSSSFLYTHFHKVHHYYTSPEPFDDMYIHPFEAAVYYCILYSPPFVFPMHPLTFSIYMILMGLTGVLDHCGIKFCLHPLIYDTRDHDNHHRLFNVNYAFPFPWFDLLHGTHQSQWKLRARPS